MSDAVHKTNSDLAARKAILNLGAGIAEVSSREFAIGLVRYLIEIADNDGCDPETAELLWDLITVIQPPAATPRAMLGGTTTLGKAFA